MTFLSEQELAKIGFAAVGAGVLVSDKASIYNPAKICLGDHVRIDDFCVLSAGEGGIVVGMHVHIAVYSSLMGAANISLSDFSNLSSRVSIYSSNDDYNGLSLTNPTIPDSYKRVSHRPVFLGKHVIVGSGSVILPGVTLEEGVAVGALSLVTKNCSAFGIYAGNPAKRIKERSRVILDVENQFTRERKDNELRD
jgi:acetyltransferase-like isoleucine patch superfamily enzyme